MRIQLSAIALVFTFSIILFVRIELIFEENTNIPELLAVVKKLVSGRNSEGTVDFLLCCVSALLCCVLSVRYRPGGVQLKINKERHIPKGPRDGAMVKTSQKST